MSEQQEGWFGPAETPADRISFGPKDWQCLQPEVASALLTLWRERAPATFGAYLAEIMTGAKPKGGRQ